ISLAFPTLRSSDLRNDLTPACCKSLRSSIYLVSNSTLNLLVVPSVLPPILSIKTSQLLRARPRRLSVSGADAATPHRKPSGKSKSLDLDHANPGAIIAAVVANVPDKNDRLEIPRDVILMPAKSNKFYKPLIILDK